MLQEFLPYGWRVTFKHGEGTISTKIAQVFVARIDPTTVKKLEKEGELRKLVDYEIAQGLAKTSARFEKKKLEIRPQSIYGEDGYYVRLDWEERDNPNFPGRILVMKNVNYRFQNPKDPTLLILVWVSTREPIEHQTYSVESLAETFLQSMQFSCCFAALLEYQIVK